MPKFIAFNTVTTEKLNEDGELVTITSQHRWRRDKLIELLRTEPHRFFEVPESHAENVIRRQSTYQEVFEDVIEEANKPKPKPRSRKPAAESDD